MASLSSGRARAVAAGRAGPVRLLPDLLTLGLLLAVLAPVGVVFGQLSFWQRFQQPWPAFLAGALCCGLVAMLRRPGWFLLAIVLVGVLATTLVMYRLMPGPSLALRDEQFRDRLQLWLTQARDGQQVYDDLAVVLWSTLAAWTAGMWAAWAALRAGCHWLVLAAGGAVLVSSIGYLPHWPAAGLAVYTFASLLFLARLNHRLLVASALVRGVPRQGGGRTAWAAYGTAVAAGAFGLVAIGWLTPALRWQAPPLHRQSVPSAGGGVQFYAAGAARSVMHDFGPNLAFGGAVALSDSPVAYVQAAAPGYLFGVAYDHYDARGWVTNAVKQLRTRPSTTPADSPASSGSGRLDLHLSGETAYQDAQPVEVTVQPRSATSVVLAAGPPLGLVAGSGDRSVNPTRVTTRGLRGAPANEVSELVAAKPIQAGASYTSRGLVSSAAPDALRAPDGQAPDWVTSSYLQLPRSLPDRVRVLAGQLTRGATTDYDRAVLIQNYLRTLAYDQNIPSPPPGEDGVDYLLFVTGRGYCDYFASALAVMLRSVGVPARVVGGYVMHETGTDGRYVVREKDAHAWTEVFIAGYGWQRFDATPGGAGQYVGAGAARVPAGVNLAAAAAPLTGSAWTADGRPGAPRRSRSALNPDRIGALQLSRTALITGLIGLAASIAIGLWLRTQRDGRQATLSAWRWTSIFAGVIERRRWPHETPAEYAASLSAAAGRSAPMRDLAAMYGRARYGRPVADMPLLSRAWRRAATSAAGLLRAKFARRGRNEG